MWGGGGGFWLCGTSAVRTPIKKSCARAPRLGQGHPKRGARRNRNKNPEAQNKQPPRKFLHPKSQNSQNSQNPKIPYMCIYIYTYQSCDFRLGSSSPRPSATRTPPVRLGARVRKGGEGASFGSFHREDLS